MWTLLQTAPKLSMVCGGELQWKGVGTVGCVSAAMSGVGAELAVTHALMACFKLHPLPLLGMNWPFGRWMQASLTVAHLELTYLMAVMQFQSMCPESAQNMHPLVWGCLLKRAAASGDGLMSLGSCRC